MSAVRIENIERLRQDAGIDDVELREDVRRLRVGDHVRVTLLADGKTGAKETVVLRITRVRAGGFCGELTGPPATSALASLGAGSSIDFSSDHVHSIPKRR